MNFSIAVSLLSQYSSRLTPKGSDPKEKAQMREHERQKQWFFMILIWKLYMVTSVIHYLLVIQTKSGKRRRDHARLWMPGDGDHWRLATTVATCRMLSLSFRAPTSLIPL